MDEVASIDWTIIRPLTLEEQAERAAERRATELAKVQAFDPLVRDKGGRPRKVVPAHLAPELWADACKVMAGEKGWGWRTVQRKFRPVFQFSIPWLKSVAQDGSLERIAPHR